MQRLSENSRIAICNKAIAHACDADQKKLNADALKLADDVYRDILTPEEIRKINRLPKGWLPELEYIEVEYGGTYGSVHFGSSRRVPYTFCGRCAKQYNARHDLAQRLVEIDARTKELKARRKDLTSKVMATLKSVTTVKRLHEVWPESKQFTEGMSFEIANLPALPIKELNKLLGIAA